MSSLRSEASFASARSTLSRAPSTGLSMHINNLKLQTASPTPAPEWSNLSAPKAGVSRQSYNVAQPLGSTDMSVDSAVDGSGRMSVQRGLTPTGATFGAMRTMLDNNSSNGTRNASRSPTSMPRPFNERQASNGSWNPRSGSVKAPRFGDVSYFQFCKFFFANCLCIRYAELAPSEPHKLPPIGYCLGLYGI